MQNKVARLTTHSHIRTRRKDMFMKLNWLTVHQLVVYHSVLATFRIRASKEPEYLSSIMSRDNRVNRIIIPNTTLSLAMKSYCYRGAAQWNSIPEEIRRIAKIGLFKSKLKEWIRSRIPQFINEN